MDRELTIKVKNMPNLKGYEGFVVARLVDGELWYYGIYDSFERAEEVRSCFENGVIVCYYKE